MPVEGDAVVIQFDHRGEARRAAHRSRDMAVRPGAAALRENYPGPFDLPFLRGRAVHLLGNPHEDNWSAG